MKNLALFFLCVFFAAPVFSQTYVTEEFIVEGDTIPASGETVVIDYGYGTPATGAVVTTQGGAVITPTDNPVYVGMNQYHVIEVMGQPTYIEKFTKFRSRKQGVYDEIWTYQTPSGPITVFIKERRVLKIGP